MIDLPDDDGLVAVVRWRNTPMGLQVSHQLLNRQQAKEARGRIVTSMRTHDARSKRERWGGNQWGEGWVTKPHQRQQLERTQPLLSTDLPYRQWGVA